MVMAKTNPPASVILPPKPIPVPPPAPGGQLPDIRCIPPAPPKPGSFEAKDANGDGKLNADEFANEGGPLQNAIEKIKDPDKFDRYDADNDGYVTKQENAIGEFRDAVGSFKKSQVGLPDFKKAGEKVENKAAEGPKPE